MSEYQYYEFRAIDRPLEKKEMDALRALSTRAEITPTSFTNTYNYGDFRGDPSALVARYFDAFVYVANWGTHQFMVRLPQDVIDAETASAYCDGEVLRLDANGEYVVLDFSTPEEEEPDDDWEEGEPWMPSLIALRADLIRGDHRALYIAWLASLRAGGWDDEEDQDELVIILREPPVPPGLAKLTVPLRALADFLRVEDELIEAASAGSIGEPPAGPSAVAIASWIASVPEADKDAYLLRFVADEEDVSLRAELSRRFREATAPGRKKPAPETGRRTIAQLLAARDALIEAKNRAKPRPPTARRPPRPRRGPRPDPIAWMIWPVASPRPGTGSKP